MRYLSTKNTALRAFQLAAEPATWAMGQSALDTISTMTELTAKVTNFFGYYQRAMADSEVERIAALYADVFLFGDPAGVRSVSKEDFIRVLPRRKEFFASVGLTSSTIHTLDASELGSSYVLANVTWKMRFERRDRQQSVESVNSASYILFVVGDSFRIVVQLDHQDLVKKAEDLG